MSKKEDLYIEILKYGKDNISGGVTFTRLKKHLTNLGFDYKSNEEDEKHWRYLFQDSFSETRHRGAEPSAYLDSEKKGEETKTAFLDMEAYFRLLEHRELKDARRSSFHATILAIIAIFISIVSAGYSIFYANKQMDSAIKVEQLELLKFDQKILSEELEPIINNQETLIDVQTNTGKE